MTRKNRLLDTLTQYLDYDNCGSFTARQYRRGILNRIVRDFYNTRMVPPHWHALNAEHVKCLVEYWKKIGLNDLTIMNYLASLRYFTMKINHDISGIDNQSLGLMRLKPAQKIIFDGDKVLAEIQAPIARILFSLQIKVGLTLNEALNITPNIHIHSDSFWITRELSVNHQDRFVPIETHHQKEIIQTLNQMTGGNQSLAIKLGSKQARSAYRLALSALQLSTRISYRYLYVYNRFHDLCLYNNKIDSRYIVTKETGFNITSPIWKIIYE